MNKNIFGNNCRVLFISFDAWRIFGAVFNYINGFNYLNKNPFRKSQ